MSQRKKVKRKLHSGLDLWMLESFGVAPDRHHAALFSKTDICS